jgi:hypothetical protein
MSDRRTGLFPEQTKLHWACPCGSEPPRRGHGTIVALWKPVCPFCGQKFEEYRRAAGDDGKGGRE